MCVSPSNSVDTNSGNKIKSSRKSSPSSVEKNKVELCELLLSTVAVSPDMPVTSKFIADELLELSTDVIEPLALPLIDISAMVCNEKKYKTIYRKNGFALIEIN